MINIGSCACSSIPERKLESFSLLPVPEPSTFGVGPHIDNGCLVFLLQDDVGGLEIFNGDKWIPVVPISNTLVVNIGLTLEVLSFRRFKATLHRVRNSLHSDRYSVPYFYEPSLSTPLTDTYTYGDIMLSTFKRSFPQK